ncbi:MAG: hypothetical protein WD059_08765 [Balneolaceae bacterium]
MAITKKLVLIGFLLTGCTQQSTQWYKGNLHTHSYWSDGDDYPEMIMKWYKDQSYDFVALSDHNILAEGEKWIEVEKGSSHERAFKKYLESYDSTWVEYKELDDLYSVRLKTLEEYRSLSEEEGEFLIIKSEEITDGFENKPVHVNATNIQEFIEPQGGESVEEVMQNNIDAVLEQRKATGEPILPHINHPNFYWAVTAEDLKNLEGEQFFEVYNGHPLVHNYGDSLRSGTEQIWDEVITHYLLEGKPIMYGIAVDDAHEYHDQDINKSNPGRGWIQVKSNTLSPDSLISAMERGDFYSSTGVSLTDISFDGNTLSVEIVAEEEVNYTTQFIGTSSGEISQPGKLFDSVKGTSASYSFSGDELYVRAKIISDKLKENPYAENEVEVAWTQPVILRDR